MPALRLGHLRIVLGVAAAIVVAVALAFVILGDRVRDVQTLDGGMKIFQVTFMVELRIVIANDDQTLVCIGLVPFPQRGNHSLAVNSTKGPHIQENDFAAQIR